MPIDALAIKADIEARAKEEKLAKWEARHGRPGKPSPPPPSPGAGKRAAKRLFEQAKEAQVRDNPMILLAWGENKEGQRQYAASTTGLGSGTGIPSGSTEDGPALAPNTVGPRRLGRPHGPASTRRVDRRTGPIDAATHEASTTTSKGARRRPAVQPTSAQLAAGRSGQLRGGGGAGGAASERSTHRRPASPKKAATSHRGAASASARAPSPKASTRPKAASAPASKPTAGVSAGGCRGAAGGLQGGCRGCRGLQGGCRERRRSACSCWIGVGAAGGSKKVGASASRHPELLRHSAR